MVEAVKQGNINYRAICPKCCSYMEPGSHGVGLWECPWRDCGFYTSEIPDIDGIAELFELKRKLEDIKKYSI